MFTEEDWNDQAIKLVEEKGVDAGGAAVRSLGHAFSGDADALSRYTARARPWQRRVRAIPQQVTCPRLPYSCVFLAAWKFRTDNKVSWDLVVINPPYVYGPPVNEVTDPQSLGTSQKMLFDILTGAYSEEQYETTDFQFVDARDVAEIHVRAAEIEEAGNTRALISRAAVFGQDLLDAANAISPKPYDGIPVGKPGSTKSKPHERDVSIEQFKRIYGFKLHTTEETIIDSIADFKKRGWIP